MYRVGIVNNNGKVYSQNFETKKEVDDFVLNEAEKGIKKAVILNKKTQEKELINF